MWVPGQLSCWDISLCFCIFAITCEGESPPSIGLLQGPVVMEVLNEGMSLG